MAVQTQQTWVCDICGYTEKVHTMGIPDGWGKLTGELSTDPIPKKDYELSLSPLTEDRYWTTAREVGYRKQRSLDLCPVCRRQKFPS